MRRTPWLFARQGAGMRCQVDQPYRRPLIRRDTCARRSILAERIVEFHHALVQQFGNNVHPQLDSVIRIASLTKLMTSEMLVKLLDQGVVKLDDPLSKYAPPGARVPTYQGTPIRRLIGVP